MGHNYYTLYYIIIIEQLYCTSGCAIYFYRIYDCALELCCTSWCAVDLCDIFGCAIVLCHSFWCASFMMKNYFHAISIYWGIWYKLGNWVNFQCVNIRNETTIFEGMSLCCNCISHKLISLIEHSPISFLNEYLSFSVENSISSYFFNNFKKSLRSDWFNEWVYLGVNKNFVGG